MAARKNQKGVKRTLLMGVFWRILIIEVILLAWSLGYRAYTQGAGEWDLIWYAMRIILLVGIILAFMMITLGDFLTRKVITPLEVIAEANRKLGEGLKEPGRLKAARDWLFEFKQIVDTRDRMLDRIHKESEDRLKLVEFIRETFGRYVSEEVVERILASPRERELGGQRKKVTVLMSDLRGFTHMAESMPPEQTVALLNRYFTAMSEVVLAQGGIVEDIIGDGMMAVFGALEEKPDDAARAVACGIHMQLALAGLNADIVAEGYAPLQMGVGINSGKVIVGNIGSPRRMKYTLVGAPVNLASRIESHAVGGQVLIGESTRQELGGLLHTEPLFHTLLKGFAQPVAVYPAQSLGEPYNLSLPAIEGLLEGPELDRPFTLWPLEGKEISPTAQAGRVVGAGENLFLAELERPLPLLTDALLKLQAVDGGHIFQDIYAKVVAKGEKDGRTLYQLHLTGISAADWRALQKRPDHAPAPHEPGGPA